jgi:hypothetical protein
MAAHSAAIGPRATLVMTARERHSPTVDAIESIVANTTVPYRFLYADSGAPEWLRDILARRSEEWNLEILRFDDDLWPNQIRKRIAPAIETDYVVFIDNDVAVEEGWLERLIACADETGAGVVGPLYFVGGAGTTPKIHMAGGRLSRHETDSGIVLEEAHRLADRLASEVVEELKREPCDFAEYHCVLMRKDLAQSGAVFDDEIVAVHEHIDAALSARRSGRAVWFEPDARIAYQAFEPMRLSDLAFFRARWSEDAAESSIAAFCAKWDVVDEERSFGGVRQFLHQHRGRVDPLRMHPVGAARLSDPMAPHELKQTLAGLSELAERRGYGNDEWARIEGCYRIAMILMNGLYRPCGRPFLNHLAGTASVLMHYDFKVPLVVAGMLHAAYTHRPDLAVPDGSGGSELRRLLGGATPLDRRVRAYTERARRWKDLRARQVEPRNLTVDEGEILIIAAANEVDMHLSGEIAFSGRSDIESPPIAALMVYACEAAGAAGLGDTLRAARDTLPPPPRERPNRPTESFRVFRGQIRPAVSAPSALMRASRET